MKAVAVLFICIQVFCCLFLIKTAVEIQRATTESIRARCAYWQRLDGNVPDRCRFYLEPGK
jgi:hypothetical protein